MLPRIKPMRLPLAREPFDDPNYVFELKHDGFRAVAYLYNGQCKLIYRTMRSMRFDSLRAELAKLPAWIQSWTAKSSAWTSTASAASTNCSKELSRRELDFLRDIVVPAKTRLKRVVLGREVSERLRYLRL